MSQQPFGPESIYLHREPIVLIGGTAYQVNSEQIWGRIQKMRRLPEKNQFRPRIDYKSLSYQK
jgi:hypothetical protein